MKLLALVRDPEGIGRFLTALGLPTTVPPHWPRHSAAFQRSPSDVAACQAPPVGR
jgi:hypothetical protein